MPRELGVTQQPSDGVHEYKIIGDAPLMGYTKQFPFKYSSMISCLESLSVNCVGQLWSISKRFNTSKS